ncbi:MAG TPA: hypothetical protein VGR62_25440 [Candidatus Binatia bacterium]|jgi:hypothetical protein|nr:hypothetical protein [Candidatus Binatia bacterium]
MKTRTATWPAGLLTALVLGAAIPAGAQTTTTTSTTLPPSGCVAEASLTSASCRTDELMVQLASSGDLGRTGTTLTNQVTKLDHLLTEAETAQTAGDVATVKTKLKRAGRVLKAMNFRLRSRNGRRNVAEATRVDLQAQVVALDADLKALRNAS